MGNLCLSSFEALFVKKNLTKYLPAGDVLGDEVEHVLGLHDLVELDDVRVAHLRLVRLGHVTQWSSLIGQIMSRDTMERSDWLTSFITSTSRYTLARLPGSRSVLSMILMATWAMESLYM